MKDIRSPLARVLTVVLCLIFKRIAHQTLNCAHKMAQSEHMAAFPAASWPTAIYHTQRERQRKRESEQRMNKKQDYSEAAESSQTSVEGARGR